MAIADYMGGFFDKLGWTGAGVTVLGALGFGLTHGYIAGKLAKYMAENADPVVDPADMYNKADVITSGVLATIPVGFGIARTTKFRDYESDVLDFFGNVFGGGLIYEAGSLFEVMSSLLKEI